MSIGLEVGRWFASAYVAKLLSVICSFINDQCKYRANIKRKLKRLEKDLQKIQAVLHEADKRKIQNPALQEWLRDLKDACYEADDILDIFVYNSIKDKVDKLQNQVSSTSLRLRKHVRKVAKRISFLDDEGKELNDILENFRRIIKDMGFLMQLISSEPSISENVHDMMQTRETTSLSKEPQLFGRDRERRYLIDQILEINSNDGASSSKNVHVLPVVGIGGVGKTTLVQDVYSNQKIEGHFDLKAWVCVSDDFDVKRLVKELIESATITKPQDFHNLQNFDAIQNILKSGLAGKKYLIVLDDVWNEVATKWEDLQAILNFGEKGSKVVVTTRNQNIADMMGTRACISLEGLPEDDYWRFFVQCAFGDNDPRDYQNLEDIGRQVAKRLGGNPLAAKTVGAVLKYDLNVTYWREVLESKRWVVDQHEDGIMSVLRLSFDYLPTYLKQCFIFCSLFPQDYKFKVSKLVRLWIAHGYIQSDMEEIGVKYFDELFRRSFFQKVKYSVDIYVIHDLLHDLAKQLSGGEVFDVAENKPIRDDPKRVRHVYVSANNLSLVCCNEYWKKKLRSLVVTGWCSNSLDMLKELRGLRMLIINGSNGELLPESIFAKMTHLRYLEIEGYEKRCSDNKLPKSLCMLYHLQVISVGDWSNDHIDGVLPDKINRLINLLHLDAGTRGVAGIGTLRLLQELQFYVNERESGFEMGQLQHMSDLRRLHIRGLGRVGSKEEACEAMLENKEHLKELTLDWRGQENADKDDDVLEGLRPHQNLQSLTIRKYSGRRSPQWWNESWASSCSYLQKITLSGCRNWEVLPPIGLLPHLQTLTLFGMKGLKRMGRELYVNCNNNNKNAMILFPSLETLRLIGMPELMEWWKVEEDEYGLFPRLSELNIKRCPKLRGPLFLPSQLKVLTVGGDVSRLIEWVPPPLHKLPSLERLRFVADKKMTRMGAEWKELFQHLSSLRSLTLRGCRRMSSATALQLFKIGWHKISHIPTIIIDDMYVQHQRSIKELTLSWEGQENADEEDDDVLEGLRHHHNLRRLRISHYHGHGSLQFWNGSWAAASHLQNIVLKFCPNWEVLPPFALLPHLKHLQLSRMDGVRQMGAESYGNRNNRSSMLLFPSLETLTLYKMPELTEWWKVEEDEYGLFPRLSTLDIRDCPKLRGPLFLPSQLKVLYVGGDVSRLIEWVPPPLHKLPSLEELMLCDDEKMTRMGAEWEEWFQHLSSLRSLTFWKCYKLECLPSNLLSSTLQKLDFYKCSKMKSLPEGLPTSLQQLFIQHVSSELDKGCSKDGREWHKISHIPNIFINGTRYVHRQH